MVVYLHLQLACVKMQRRHFNFKQVSLDLYASAARTTDGRTSAGKVHFTFL